MKNEIYKKGLIVTKVIVRNRTGTSNRENSSEYEIHFNDRSYVSCDCDDVEELKNEHVGIYELLDDGSFKQIEDWEE